MAPGQKESLAPRVPNWGLSEANALYGRKCLWDCWDFSAPPAVIWRPDIDWAPGELRPLWPPSLRLWVQWRTFNTRAAFFPHAKQCFTAFLFQLFQILQRLFRCWRAKAKTAHDVSYPQRSSFAVRSSCFCRNSIALTALAQSTRSSERSDLLRRLPCDLLTDHFTEQWTRVHRLEAKHTLLELLCTFFCLLCLGECMLSPQRFRKVQEGLGWCATIRGNYCLADVHCSFYYLANKRSDKHMQ